MTTYGRTNGLQVDPMEKKPLYHFHPGTPILSLGSVGCNMGCTFCQNASLSKTGNPALLPFEASPKFVVEMAGRLGCASVAFTYNEPIVWSEYAIAIAAQCRASGLHTVVVTAGSISKERRTAFFEAMDAANIDLKGFTEEFYRNEIDASLEAVKGTLRYVARETDCWLEITNLVIPGLNDGEEEMKNMTDWIVTRLGPEVPLHLTAFRPAYRRTDLPPTPVETLYRLRDIGLRAGLRYVYSGNIADPAGQSTYCPQCRQTVILRTGFSVGEINIDDEACCRFCGQSIAGRFVEP